MTDEMLRLGQAFHEVCAARQNLRNNPSYDAAVTLQRASLELRNAKAAVMAESEEETLRAERLLGQTEAWR